MAFRLAFVDALGRTLLGAVHVVGSIGLFAGRAVRYLFPLPRLYGQFAPQAVFVGVESLPIILLTAFFTGGVLALQSYNGFGNALLANTQVPKVVALSMLRELGPVLGALMLASRVGSAMAAELGTMRVTEQIDALQTMAMNPLRYLVLPRILACVAMLPLLIVLANLVGIFGGNVVGVHVLGLSPHLYSTVTFDAIGSQDLLIGLVKAVVFGFIIGLMATYHGFHARNGAEGVGTATTRSVVYSAVAILVSDYFITAAFV